MLLTTIIKTGEAVRVIKDLDSMLLVEAAGSGQLYISRYHIETPIEFCNICKQALKSDGKCPNIVQHRKAYYYRCSVSPRFNRKTRRKFTSAVNQCH